MSGSIHQKIASAAYKTKAPERINNYVLDKELSNKKTKVYYNPNTNQVVIGHSGTRSGSANDIKNDVKLTLGQIESTKRFKNAERINQEAIKKYEGATVSQTGHSLGGAIGSRIALKNSVENSKAVTFNSGAGPLEIGGNLLDSAKCKANPSSTHCQKLANRTEVTTGLDPISAVNLTNSAIKKDLVAPSSVNVHSLSNFE